jgi:hypothetical protein
MKNSFSLFTQKLKSLSFFPISRPDRFWGPPGLLSSGYQELFSWG